MPEPELEMLWSFPDLKKPKCDSVTDTELLRTLLSLWPADPDGVSRIPYSFTPSALWTKPLFSAISTFFTLDVHSINDIFPKYQTMVIENLKLGLRSWEEASAGKIQFVEDSLGPYSKGIAFYLADPHLMLEQESRGLTIRKLDNNGFLDQAAVILPSDGKFWNMAEASPATRAYNIKVINHEIGHALGLNHLHDFPTILYKLKAMLFGNFCSVMPYSHEVEPNKKINPNEVYLTPLPGELDKRSIALNHCEDYPPQARQRFINDNIFYAFLHSSAITTTYTSIYDFAKNLKNPKSNQPLLTPEQTQLVADGIFLGMMLYMRFPLATTATFTVNTLLKYLPEKWLDYLPHIHLAQWLHNRLSPFIVGTVLAIKEGGGVVPMLETLLASEMGSLLGALVGHFSGEFSAQTVNKIMSVCMHYFHSETEKTDTPQPTPDDAQKEKLLSQKDLMDYVLQLPKVSSRMSFFQPSSPPKVIPINQDIAFAAAAAANTKRL